MANIIYVNFVNALIPESSEKATSSPSSEQWMDAMKIELKNLEKNYTWKLVDKPENVKIIDLKWIFKQKGDNTVKARIAAKGFQ